MHAATGGQAGAGPGPPKVQPPFSFFSEAQDGLQKFWLVRAGARTPEEVGPRESGEPILLPLRAPSFVKDKRRGQLRR